MKKTPLVKMDAKKFIEYARRKFPCMYKSDLAFFANALLTNSVFKWENGLIVSDDDISDCPDQLTDEGWKSAVNSQHVPTSWPEPTKHSPIFHIPDDASKEWLEAISMFCYKVEKINENDYHDYLKAFLRFGGMTKDYQEDYLRRYFGGFCKCKEMLAFYEVHARCTVLLYPAPKDTPLPLKKGSVVRLKTGVKTAIVESDQLTFGNGPVKGACYLSAPLGGTQYWNKDDLVVVENPK